MVLTVPGKAQFSSRGQHLFEQVPPHARRSGNKSIGNVDHEWNTEFLEDWQRMDEIVAIPIVKRKTDEFAAAGRGQPVGDLIKRDRIEIPPPHPSKYSA